MTNNSARQRERLPREFYEADPLEVAPGLLGSLLIHRHPALGELIGRIVETEAYRGEEDLACHASAGVTTRTQVMFGPPGHAYVYLIYGMYNMLNAVTWPEGRPAAVLIRAIEPVLSVKRTTDGPGKLTMAMDIDRTLNGQDLCGQRLFICRGGEIALSDIETGPRIGVDYAGEWAKKPWRFWIRDSRYVSR